MKSDTFRRLQGLRERYGPGVFGKIAQKLLALAFYDAGFRHVVERAVQGVDIDAAGPGAESYALEVKTTDGDRLTISRENIEALEDRAKDGYVPVIAALRIRLLEDWVFARIPMSQLRPGSLSLTRLRAYRMKELEALVRPTFATSVDRHFRGALSGGETYLSEALARRRTGS